MDESFDYADVFVTALGWIATVGHDETLKMLVFGYESPQDALQAARDRWPVELAVHSWNPEISVRLQAYAVGVPDDFQDVRLDLDHIGEFERKVVDRCRSIPVGETVTYAELARLAGSPKAARAVGNVMAKNRFPLVVPCHRVVQTGGGLGGYSGHLGLKAKRRLLEMEGGLASRQSSLQLG
jgi:methylated-DNA-[protein]-cysteine S-methyltransferase